MSQFIDRAAALDAICDGLSLVLKLPYFKIDSCDNAISRAEAIRIVHSCCDPVEELKKLPAVQPERIKGKWMSGASCSICGFHPWYEGDIHKLNYCPNCGAKMEEEK